MKKNKITFFYLSLFNKRRKSGFPHENRFYEDYMSSVSSSDSDNFFNFITQEHTEGELRGFSFEKGRSSKSLRMQTKFSSSASMENCQRIEDAAIHIIVDGKKELSLRQLVAIKKNLNALGNVTHNNKYVLSLNNSIYENDCGLIRSVLARGVSVYAEITGESNQEAEKYNETLEFSQEFGLMSEPTVSIIFEVIDILIENEPAAARKKIDHFLLKNKSETLSTLVTSIIPFLTDRSVAASLCKRGEEPEIIQSKAFSILTPLVTQRGKQSSAEWAAFRSGLSDRTF